jgi:hypothetical protein
MTEIKYDIKFSKQELEQFMEELKPAVLANNELNGTVLGDYLGRHKMEPTVANLHKACAALVTALAWQVPPKPKASPSAKPFLEQQKSAIKEERAFLEKKHAAEKKEAQAKADEASIAQAKRLIAAYTPITSSGRAAYGEMGERQTQWTNDLNSAIARKIDLQVFVKNLNTEIQARYMQFEAQRERM